jgi:8-oxo-dGTP pyrophosphatase MutT (NUDIX family)
MGGNAFSNPKLRRISRDEIVPTLKNFIQKLSYDTLDWAYVSQNIMGSAGKQADSGDLDIAMDEREFGLDDLRSIADKWRSIQGQNAVVSKHLKTGQLNLLAPIAGSDEFVQVDLILGPQDWLKFAHHSPGKDMSPYKGVFISTLMGVMAKLKKDYELRVPAGSLWAKGDDTRIAEVIWAYNLEKGINRKWRLKLKSEENLSDVDPDFWETNLQRIAQKAGVELKDVPRFTRTGYVTDPVDVIRILIDDTVTPADIDTFEKLVAVVKARVTPEQWKTIKNRTVEALWRSAAKKEFNSLDDIKNLSIFKEYDQSLFEAMTEVTTKPKLLKAGLVPYFFDREAKQVMVCLMIPSDPNFGGSQPQIAKGGIDPGENALQAAKREAWEELGLPDANIKNIKEVAKTQSGKFTWFVAEVMSMNLSKPGHETGEVLWLTLSDAFKQIRDWQKPVLGYLVSHLRSKKQEA